MNDGLKADIIAETKALGDLLYFELVRSWGGVQV